MAATGNKLTLVDRGGGSGNLSGNLSGGFSKPLGSSSTTIPDNLGQTLNPNKDKPRIATEQVLRAPTGSIDFSTGAIGRSPEIAIGTTTTSTPLFIDRVTPRYSPIYSPIYRAPQYSPVRLGKDDDDDRFDRRDFFDGWTRISFARDRNVRGTQRDDYATGSNRDDIFAGRDGDDAIFGLDGDDTLFGNADDDTIDGGEGNDWILGGRDDDVLDGREGDDIITGNRGDDILLGDNDDDLLFGGRDDDRLYGGKGRDTLTGDLGRDRLNGGLEADAFVLRDAAAFADRPEDADLIEDFTPSEGDRLYILASTTFNPSDLALFDATASFGSIEVDGRDTPIVRSAVNILHAPTNRYLGVVTSTTEAIDVARVSANLAIVTSFDNIPR